MSIKNIFIMYIIILVVSVSGCTSNSELDDNSRQTEENTKLELKMSELRDSIEQLKSSNEKQKIENEQLYIELKQSNEIISELKSELIIPKIQNHFNKDADLRLYKGVEGIFSLPNYEAEIVIDVEEMQNNKILKYVGPVNSENGELWGIVLSNNYGDTKIGYVPLNDLEKYEATNYYSIESIGDIHLGDRIEIMQGYIERDYYIISENICIYNFPKFIYGTVDDEVFLENDYIDAFVANDFHVLNLRTNSIDYKLKTGYGVGDNAEEVLSHYSNIYDCQLNDDYQLLRIIIQLNEYEQLNLLLDSLELTEESLIKDIELVYTRQ